MPTKAKALTDEQMAEARAVEHWQLNPYRALLTARFPKAFAPWGAVKRPLKRQVYGDIRERCPDLSARQVQAGLEDYTGGPSYHRACAPNAVRIDLDGQAVGTVTLEEAAYHIDRLLSLQAKWRKLNKQRALERKAKRDSAEAMAKSDPEYRGADAD